MRLHHLRLTAFGPFAATQTVDFDELSAAGLFLLHGPTGAGKTSVLDGVCFALYGQVPGARPATRLRSDHAAPGTPTEVVLELTLAGRRLEITRRPEQLRAKKRGSGFTTDKAVTLLREYDGGQWRGLSRSHQEVGEEIRQLIGMSCEQFCQVVLLPQGQFSTFLRAGAAERATVLGRLFDTRRFKAVEHWLRDRKLEAERQLARADQELTGLAARMRQAAGPGPEPELGDGRGDTAAHLLEWAAVLRCDAREEYGIARAAVGRSEEAHRAAASAAAAARELHALQARHAEARRRAAALDLERPARTAARARLAEARRATTVEPALALTRKAATHHAATLALAREAAAALATAGEHLPAAGPASPLLPSARRAPDSARGEGACRRTGSAAGRVESAEGRSRRGPDDRWGEPAGDGADGSADPAGDATEGSFGPCGVDPRTTAVEAARRFGAPEGERGPAAAASGTQDTVGAGGLLGDVVARRVGELRQELGGLAGAEEAETRLRAIGERKAELEREERADEEAAREAHGWLEAWPRLRGGLQGWLDTALEAAGRAAELAGEVEAARRRRDAAGERDALAAEAARAEDAARDARDRTAEAREAWQDLREARIAGIAAELAGELAEGEPCRVCGSPDHPAPARPAHARITRADEDAAYAGFQRASGAYERTRGEALRVRAALEAAAATAGDTPQAELAAAYAVLEAEHAAVAHAAADVTEARTALARAEEERDRRAAQRQEALSRTAARTSRREELDEQYERLSADSDRARAGHASVAARRERLAARIDLLERAARAVRDRAESAERLAEAEAGLMEAVARAGYASPAEAAAALLPPGELRDAERRSEAWAGQEAALETELAAPEPAAAATAPPADPAAANATLEAATRSLRDASAAESAAASRCAELDRLGRQATARVRELAPARAESARIKRLSDLASANTAENQYRMELETYVLAARLEQVAAAAGVRLQRMSAGRYTLVHSDARSGGRSKSGLGLMVVDAWTGTERDTSTLSGGETFFASLALALGLADVVTDEAGGIRLDTLFIDEGFGSLDDQTLDEVLDVLDGLRERDRAVGIVSHVADLRHRIPAQLRVVKGRDGSTVRLRTAGDGRGAETVGARAG
ncbi:AAA family ATPase [Streptomyces sp.]|uniref:AAA family ATPase n=1 Tax=Streptomyces sp. TaxID=1931 RepID=UPI002F3F197E